MIICIDIGNTNIKYGVFEKDKLIATFRVASKRTSTADEYGVIVRDLLASAKLSKKDITGVIMSSVIPQLNYTMEHMCEQYLGKKPLVVAPGLKTGINLKVDSQFSELDYVGSIVDSVGILHVNGIGIHGFKQCRVGYHGPYQGRQF